MEETNLGSGIWNKEFGPFYIPNPKFYILPLLPHNLLFLLVAYSFKVAVRAVNEFL